MKPKWVIFGTQYKISSSSAGRLTRQASVLSVILKSRLVAITGNYNSNDNEYNDNDNSNYRGGHNAYDEDNTNNDKNHVTNLLQKEKSSTLRVII